MSASIVERIWGPNRIRKALHDEVSPPVQHIDYIRHQLSELMLEAIESNDLPLMQYSTSELDRFASTGSPITDSTVRSTAYIAHALGWGFPSQYARFTSDHSRKEFYFLTVLERASYLPSLQMFDQLCATRQQFNFHCDPSSHLTPLTNQPVFKLAHALCARNEKQRLLQCTQLNEWFQHHCENTPQFIQEMMGVAATYGASETFDLGFDAWRNSRNQAVLNKTGEIVEKLSNTCVAYDQMDLFARVFDAFPFHRQYMFSMWDYADKAGNSIKNLEVVMPYLELLSSEQLQHFASEDYPANTTRRAAIAEHAQHLLQRATLLQNLPSAPLAQRRKV